MDVTYFEKRLAVSIALMNAATEPGARSAHRGMADGYRALVRRESPKGVRRSAPEQTLSTHGYDIRDALDGWVNDGGSCRESWS